MNPRDISRNTFTTWAARTATGMLLVSGSPARAGGRSGADLVTLRDEAGRTVPARLIGPVIGDAPEGGTWTIDAAWSIDPEGAPLASVVSDAGEREERSGHAWGGLGLPLGLETRVRRVEASPRGDEVALAHRSSGQGLGEATWWLTLAPGDRVTFEYSPAMVIGIDRRKRTVEVEVDGEMRAVALDEIQPIEA